MYINKLYDIVFDIIALLMYLLWCVLYVGVHVRHTKLCIVLLKIKKNVSRNDLVGHLEAMEGIVITSSISKKYN